MLSFNPHHTTSIVAYKKIGTCLDFSCAINLTDKGNLLFFRPTGAYHCFSHETSTEIHMKYEYTTCAMGNA